MSIRPILSPAMVKMIELVCNYRIQLLVEMYDNNTAMEFCRDMGLNPTPEEVFDKIIYFVKGVDELKNNPHTICSLPRDVNALLTMDLCLLKFGGLEPSQEKDLKIKVFTYLVDSREGELLDFRNFNMN
ncbi:MAG TPA: hypothetical protein PLT50_04310 [bacterium]|nr:hypothetical protein [bacterium]